MDFKTRQASFMAHIRDPEQPAPEGVEDRRMQIYRELFFNNLDGFVSSGFPVLKTLYTQAQWQELVRQFFIQHDCKTPIFVEIAQEFLHFLQHEYQQQKHDEDFMFELAHYEWLELAVSVAQEREGVTSLTPEQLDDASLCLAQTARVAQYSYEVHRISDEYRPDSPSDSPLFFCVFLDVDEEVKFLQLNPLSAQVLAKIEASPGVELHELLIWLEQTFANFEPEVLRQGAISLLSELVTKGIIKKQ